MGIWPTQWFFPENPARIKIPLGLLQRGVQKKRQDCPRISLEQFKLLESSPDFKCIKKFTNENKFLALIAKLTLLLLWAFITALWWTLTSVYWVLKRSFTAFVIITHHLFMALLNSFVDFKADSRLSPVQSCFQTNVYLYYILNALFVSLYISYSLKSFKINPINCVDIREGSSSVISTCARQKTTSNIENCCYIFFFLHSVLIVDTSKFKKSNRNLWTDKMMHVN